MNIINKIQKQNELYFGLATEADECKTLVAYLDLKGFLYSHIHNEMFTTSWKQKRKAKDLGVQSGVPDYIILLPKKILFLEMKRVKKSKVSENQKIWIDAINNLGIKNVKAVVCYGAKEAIKTIEQYVSTN